MVQSLHACMELLELLLTTNLCCKTSDLLCCARRAAKLPLNVDLQMVLHSNRPQQPTFVPFLHQDAGQAPSEDAQNTDAAGEYSNLLNHTLTNLLRSLTGHKPMPMSVLLHA